MGQGSREVYEPWCQWVSAIARSLLSSYRRQTQDRTATVLCPLLSVMTCRHPNRFRATSSSAAKGQTSRQACGMRVDDFAIYPRFAPTNITRRPEKAVGALIKQRLHC